ncbi:hypothetical protein [Reyranella soli]|uniref:Uncharacterized protein n=1 Tax=Reyranella soli TaxID=1230389 RepID=A0A512NNI3_9HYPH|nr:hypothetical protein [Reyranella soli]GEP60500.1 hypothetical protein RSO01_76660 [Reyranella soli]
MDNWSAGFRIDEAFHPWGTLFEAVAPRRVPSGYASVKLACRSAYGFVTVYVEPAAARPDRPVTTVTYELADTGTAPRYLFAELVKRLGQPDEVTRDDSPEAANENTVVLHANWKRDKTRIGISLYGARRPSAFGDASGALYLSWVEQDVAASPFLPAWVAANDAAVAAAEGARLKVFSVRYDIYDDDYPAPSPTELALRSPHVLLTPTAIAQRLGKTTFALWSDANQSAWYLSTARTTVRLGGEDASRLHFYDIAPARGGGYTEIGTNSWSVRDAHGSTSMKDALAALETVPGVKIDRSAGHDA